MDTVVIFYNVDIYLKNIWESTSEINFMLDPFQLRADFSVSIRVLEYRRCCWSWWGLNGHSHNILQCWYLFEEHFGKLLQELTLWCITSIWVSISCVVFCIRVFEYRRCCRSWPPKILKVRQFNMLWQPQCWNEIFTAFWNAF